MKLSIGDRQAATMLIYSVVFLLLCWIYGLITGLGLAAYLIPLLWVILFSIACVLDWVNRRFRKKD